MLFGHRYETNGNFLKLLVAYAFSEPDSHRAREVIMNVVDNTSVPLTVGLLHLEAEDFGLF